MLAQSWKLRLCQGRGAPIMAAGLLLKVRYVLAVVVDHVALDLAVECLPMKPFELRIFLTSFRHGRIGHSDAHLVRDVGGLRPCLGVIGNERRAELANCGAGTARRNELA